MTGTDPDFDKLVSEIMQQDLRKERLRNDIDKADQTAGVQPSTLSMGTPSELDFEVDVQREMEKMTKEIEQAEKDHHFGGRALKNPPSVSISMPSSNSPYQYSKSAPSRQNFPTINSPSPKSSQSPTRSNIFGGDSLDQFTSSNRQTSGRQINNEATPLRRSPLQNRATPQQQFGGNSFKANIPCASSLDFGASIGRRYKQSKSSNPCSLSADGGIGMGLVGQSGNMPKQQQTQQDQGLGFGLHQQRNNPSNSSPSPIQPRRGRQQQPQLGQFGQQSQYEKQSQTNPFGQQKQQHEHLQPRQHQHNQQQNIPGNGRRRQQQSTSLW
jgi:hypothetical protein